METQKFIDLLESNNIAYQVKDVTERIFNVDTMENEFHITGEMQILIEGVGKSCVNYWFDLSDFRGGWVSFNQRYNSGIGHCIKAWGTGYDFFCKLEEGKIKQVN